MFSEEIRKNIEQDGGMEKDDLMSSGEQWIRCKSSFRRGHKKCNGIDKEKTFICNRKKLDITSFEN